MDFRTKIKKEMASQIFEVEAKTKEEVLEKYDLGVRVLKFFQYEQDPEFEKWFDDFCKKRAKEYRNIIEKEDR